MDTSKVKVFGISVGETDQIAQQFVDNFGLTFPVLRDAHSTVYNSYPVTGISPYPRDCIVDQQGIVRYLRSEYEPQTMMDIINQLSTVKVEEESQVGRVPRRLHMKVYPNPSNSQFLIQFEVASTRNISLKVYDLNGRTVLSENISRGSVGEAKIFTVDLKDYTSGIYFISIQNGRFKETRKLVLAK